MPLLPFLPLAAIVSLPSSDPAPLNPGDLAGIVAPIPPLIDGTINPEEWSAASTGEGLVDEETGVSSPENGQFWLSYDHDYVYFAYRAQDSQPATIHATEYRQNVSLNGDDHVLFNIDVLGNLDAFNSFQINPKGATTLYIAGGKAAKTEWLGEIQAKGRLTEFGYEIEARIPWKIMRLPAAGKRTVRVNVSRYMPRTQRYYSWRDTSAGKVENTGNWIDVEIPVPPVDRTLKLLPYGYLGGGNQKPIFNSGLDMKTQLAPRIEAVGTINPDFRNVENQVLSLDLSYFERVTAESRPFFQEGGNFFNTGFGTKVFLPQRIPSFDWGAKAFGNISDKLDFGVMALQTLEERTAVVASTTYIPRARQNLNFAYAGLRDKEHSNDTLWANYGFGSGAWFSWVQAAGTFDSTKDFASKHSIGQSYNNKGLSFYWEWESVEKRFEPRIGYQADVDYKGISAGPSYLQTYQKGAIMETAFEFNAANYWHLDGLPYRRSTSFSGSITSRNGIDFDFGGTLNRFKTFDDQSIFFSIEKPRRDPYRRWQYDYSFGRFMERPFQSHSLSFAYRALPRLQTGIGFQWLSSDGDDERQIISSVNWEIDSLQSISGRAIQRGNAWNAYLSYKRAGGRGAEYFVILGDPNSRSFESRLIVKAVYPLELKL
ncbi:MAG: hypothetical protein JST40_01415 [Armatimonadetes bacterium]|nr:hypothetical protein [Armatimonadota bacterium]